LALAAPFVAALADAGNAAHLACVQLTMCDLGFDACAPLCSIPSLDRIYIWNPVCEDGSHMQEHVIEICNCAAGPLKLLVPLTALGREWVWERELWQRMQAAGITDKVQMPTTFKEALTRAPLRVWHPRDMIFHVLHK